jgi:hypothetical protein
MQSTNRRSGYSLAVLGLAGILFFWLSDPRWGLGLVLSRPDSPIDAIHQHLVGTVVGLLGSAIVLLIGLWQLSRRAV